MLLWTAPRSLEQRRQAEALDRRRRARLHVVGADGLVGVGVGSALDQGDAGAALGEEPGRRAAADAGADDRDVVALGSSARGYLTLRRIPFDLHARVRADRRRRQALPVHDPRHPRRAPPQQGLRPARLPRGAELDRQRPLRPPPGLLRRRGDGDRRRLPALRGLHAGALPGMEGGPGGFSARHRSKPPKPVRSRRSARPTRSPAAAKNSGRRPARWSRVRAKPSIAWERRRRRSSADPGAGPSRRHGGGPPASARAPPRPGPPAFSVPEQVVEHQRGGEHVDAGVASGSSWAIPSRQSTAAAPGLPAASARISGRRRPRSLCIGPAAASAIAKVPGAAADVDFDPAVRQVGVDPLRHRPAPAALTHGQRDHRVVDAGEHPPAGGRDVLGVWAAGPSPLDQYPWGVYYPDPWRRERTPTISTTNARRGPRPDRCRDRRHPPLPDRLRDRRGRRDGDRHRGRLLQPRHGPALNRPRLPLRLRADQPAAAARRPGASAP